MVYLWVWPGLVRVVCDGHTLNVLKDDVSREKWKGQFRPCANLCPAFLCLVCVRACVEVVFCV